jgi:HEAT repeat protein
MTGESETSISFQVGYRDGEGKLTFTPLVPYPLKPQDKTAVQAPPPPTPNRADVPARKQLPRYGTKRLTEEHLEAILTCLQDNNAYWRGQAVNHILEADVVEARREEIARGLLEQLQGSDRHVQVQSLKALARWGTRESIEPLLKFLDATSHNDVRNAAVETLGRLKDARAIETIVEYLPNAAVRDKASWALKNFGATAEAKVAAALRHKDPDVRREACLILKAIGTASSLPALQAVMNDDSKAVVEAAADAIRVINKRK